MSLWTETELIRVARHTKLATRTLDACREFLIDGITGVEAADKYKIFPATLSRGVRTLEEKRVEMVKSASSNLSDVSLIKFATGMRAKELFGASLNIVDAQPGKTYQGEVVLIDQGFLVQKVGRNGVVHDVGALIAVPALNSRMLISYPKSIGLATVAQIDQKNAVLDPDHTRRANDVAR